MPPLDPESRQILLDDYHGLTGKEATSYSEQYSENPDDDIWNTGKVYKLNMGIALNTTQPFDPDNPVFTVEPNLDADTQDYDITQGGWLVSIGDNPTVQYKARKTKDSNRLRDTKQSKETEYHKRGSQMRRYHPPVRHYR